MTLALQGKRRRRQALLLAFAAFAVLAAIAAATVAPGSQYAGAATESGYAGEVYVDNWDNAANALGPEDDTFASNTGTEVVVAFNAFGLDVPESWVIEGITVEVFGYATSAACQLEVDLGSSDSSPRTVSTPDTNGVMTFGGPADTWDGTWSSTRISALVNSDGFSVDLRNIDSADGCSNDSDTWYVDAIRVTFHGDEPTPEPTSEPTATPEPTPVSEYIARLNDATTSTSPTGVCEAADFNFPVDTSGSVNVGELNDMQTSFGDFTDTDEAVGDGRYSVTSFYEETATPETAGYADYDTIHPQSTWNRGGRTPTALGINTAMGNTAGDRAAPNVMYIITDGSPNLPTGSAGFFEVEGWLNAANAAIDAANSARASGYYVEAVYIGTPDERLQNAFEEEGYSESDAEVAASAFAQAVMTRLGGGGYLSSSFDNFHETIVQNLGCQPVTPETETPTPDPTSTPTPEPTSTPTPEPTGTPTPEPTGTPTPDPTGTPTPEPTSTPTPEPTGTPTPEPTSTPTPEPTSTPTPEPTGTPTPEPTPETVIDEVEGEKTPGSGDTPVPPDSGTGVAAGNGSGGNVWTLALAGMLVTLSGFALAAAGRRR
ncbi:MAG: vWA domain-containing protein [Dehalococcoidia bacterium]|nr:vWA domain-containing protein [Dehalococcoidia bacterium]